MKKIICFLIMSIFLVLSCTGKKEISDEGKKVIGFSQATLGSPFYVSLMEAAEKHAESMGYELKYLDGQEDIAKQNKDILDLLSTGVGVLILNPVEAEGVKPAIEEANRKGVPVITVDRPISIDVESFIGRDNKNMGYLSGQYAVELLGGKGKAKGKILEIQGSAGDKVMMARRDGFHEAVDKESGIVVIQSPYADYIRANAMTHTQDIIQREKDIDLIYAHNDDMALGALQIFEQNGMSGVYVVGVDGLMEAIKAIEDGRYHSTTLNDPSVLGKYAVDTAIKVLNGESVEKYIDGGTLLITKENASEYYDKTKVFAEVQ